jgi:DNA end-binding protein Ku
MAEKSSDHAGRASARAIWSGSISFGLVTIPVKLYTAVREKRLHFRSLHDQDQVPLKQKMVCPADGKEVHPEHIIKGYEIEKDRFVIVNQEELDAAAPKATRAIEILDFVEMDEIDPLFFDRPYYVGPTPEGAKPYKLLVEALEKKKKVGIAKIVMYGKEYLAALRPLNESLCLETMHFSDEVVAAKNVAALHVKAKVDDREMKMAEQLIDSLTTDFDPGKYHDEYRDQMLALIERKAKGEKIVMRPVSEEPRHKGHDLMAALEASLAKAKSSAKPPNGTSHRLHTVHSHPGQHVRRRKSA